MNEITPDDCLVAFVDICGWTAALEEGRHDELVKAASEIAEHAAQFNSQAKERFRQAQQRTQLVDTGGYLRIDFSFVSDCFVISAPSADLRGFLGVIRWTCMRLLHERVFLTRGAITRGHFTYDSSRGVVVGKPLADAVRMEKATSMPRIVLRDDVLELVAEQELTGLVDDDEEVRAVNIANRSPVWLSECMQKIADRIGRSDVDSVRRKWQYAADHLPRMSEHAT